jgi:MOSC domain-containing protein YiiM
MGAVVSIFSKRAHRGPMDALETAELIARRGLRGSADQGGRRQVTLLDREAWESVTAALTGDAPLDPRVRRANLYLSGVRLAHTRGRILRVGEARLRIFCHTAPCERMDESLPGLTAALQLEWRGGACAEVLVGGTIRVGDAVAFEDEDAS